MRFCFFYFMPRIRGEFEVPLWLVLAIVFVLAVLAILLILHSYVGIMPPPTQVTQSGELAVILEKLTQIQRWQEDFADQQAEKNRDFEARLRRLEEERIAKGAERVNELERGQDALNQRVSNWILIQNGITSFVGALAVVAGKVIH